MEKPAGLQTSTVAADGSRNLSYEFNDRGRGPKLNARVKLDDAGVPVSISMDGVDYIKSPVAETFTFAGGVARWKNSAEAGEQKLAGRAFYLSTQGLPEELGWLAHALLKAPGQTMALLPGARHASSARRAERRRRREQAPRDRLPDRRAGVLAGYGLARRRPGVLRVRRPFLLRRARRVGIERAEAAGEAGSARASAPASWRARSRASRTSRSRSRTRTCSTRRPDSPRPAARCSSTATGFARSARTAP